ncbi:hypothetical protein CspHIS471_0510750 [Cutaneotrichosporon sp. HIS471]|nr:hypothetical protein CspHIS471_0510750 [Cutaneotrichosporon sp. HIS471]
MCSGTCVLYKIPLVVMAENYNFVGGEDPLASKRVEIVNLHDKEITAMMRDWIASDRGRAVWDEDIGEVSS